MKQLLTQMPHHKIACTQPKAGALERLVRQMSHEHHLTICGPTLNYLTRTYGKDLALLEQVLAQASLYLGSCLQKTQALSREILEQLRMSLPKTHLFAFSDALLAQDLAKAQMLMIQSLKDKESPLALNALFARHCRLAITVKQLQKEKQAIQKIESLLKIPNFVAHRYQKYVSDYSETQLLKAADFSMQADILLKSRISAELVLSRMLTQLEL